MTRNAGKSVLFLDDARGVSYEDASKEHRARRESMELARCEAGHLVIRSGSGNDPPCPIRVAMTRYGGPYRCWRPLRDWRRVK